MVLCFAPPFDLRPWEFAHFGRKAIGWSMWERTPMIREDLVGHGFDMRTKQRWWSGQGKTEEGWRRDLDLMLVTCDMNVDAFRALDPFVPLDVLPCGIDPDLWPVTERTGDGPMKFLMAGMLNGRKDPFVAINAWQELRQEVDGFDAELHLRSQAPGMHPKMMEWNPLIVVHEGRWPRQKLVDLMLDCDVYLSTSRGEGNNKPAMEFMATGGACMASDWAGHQNWLHPEITWAIPGTMVPTPGVPGTEEFAIDKDRLKEMVLDVWRNPEEVRRRGKLSADWIRQTLSWDVVLDRLVAKFGELW
jgi:glycosyltransferase involved in cell wall biosynthesis